VTGVQYRVDQGAWSALAPSGAHVWETPFVVPSTVGSHALEARAVSADGTGTDSISFAVQ
jgi:hypothetical protein